MDLTERLVTSFDTSTALLRQLEEVMLAEARAIASQAPERLQALVAEKLELVRTLESETQRQKDWMEHAGLDFTPAGIAQLIAAHDSRSGLDAAWDALREGSRRCNLLNADNARLIQRDRKRIAMALRILSGDGGAATYDPHGRPRSDRQQSRSITQA